MRWTAGWLIHVPPAARQRQRDGAPRGTRVHRRGAGRCELLRICVVVQLFAVEFVLSRGLVVEQVAAVLGVLLASERLDGAGARGGGELPALARAHQALHPLQPSGRGRELHAWYALHPIRCCTHFSFRSVRNLLPGAGDEGDGRVQPAQFRPQCCDCNGEMLELEPAAGSQSSGFAPQTIEDLLQATRRSDSTLRVRTCFNPDCSGETRRAWVDLRCVGDKPDGTACRARSSRGDCVLLPQVLEAPEGAEDNILFVPFDAGEPMMKFDPCGHTVGLDSFVQGVEAAFGGGSARHEIKASPQLGTFCLTCPVREPDMPCADSFVHDVHHYKICGRAAYGRIKQFGLDASGFADGDGPPEGDPPGQRPGGPPGDTDSLIRAIIDTISDAQTLRCPYDGTVFEKDGACTHIDTCPGRLPDGSKHGRFCYYCGKKWCDVDPPSSSNHKNDWRTNPKRCIWFLESDHPLFRSGNGMAALQDFHKFRCIRMLHERFYTKIPQGIWRSAFDRQPDLLQNLYGNDEFPEGVSISAAEVAGYSDHAVWSEEHDCWVGTGVDDGFTGRMP